MADKVEGCVEPSKGIIGVEVKSEAQNASVKEVTKVQAKVGKPAPDFETSAYHEGGFKNIRLSEFKGQWVVVCFYPGDFTFV
jgi:hypothetical protein